MIRTTCYLYSLHIILIYWVTYNVYLPYLIQVEVIEDNYDDTFISIFSDIGGSIGVLIGMSCMTIVDGLLMIHKKIHKMINHF